MNKTAVVVGASRGIGRAIVEQLAAIDGMFVHALSRDREKMNNTFGHLKNVKCHPFDLSSNVRQQASEIFASVGSIDLLINNAGKLVNKPFTSLTHDDIEGCYQTNVIGVMETVQAAIEYISDFIHPDRHDTIGRIKDIAAGAVFIAAVSAAIGAMVIYIPKIF